MLCSFQSHNSTDSALVKLLICFLLHRDTSEKFVLGSLDSSSTSETADHNIPTQSGKINGIVWYFAKLVQILLGRWELLYVSR